MSGTDLLAAIPMSADGAVPFPVGVGEGDLPQLTRATLRLWNAFPSLDPQYRRWALAVGRVEAVQAGERYAGLNEVSVIVSGCLATGAAGSEVTGEILGPGDVVATGAPQPVSGRWITDGEFYRIDLAAWIESAGQQGVRYLLDASDERRQRLERQILCATTHMATARVADLFLAIHEAAPIPGIMLSQEQLGAMLGLRRTTVNGSCRALELSGASRTRRGGVRLVDTQILAGAACGCRQGSARSCAESADLSP